MSAAGFGSVWATSFLVANRGCKTPVQEMPTTEKTNQIRVVKIEQLSTKPMFCCFQLIDKILQMNRWCIKVLTFKDQLVAWFWGIGQQGCRSGFFPATNEKKFLLILTGEEEPEEEKHG